MVRPTLVHERRFWRDGMMRIAGVDEVGRGALAGPVVAAAAIFSEDAARRLMRHVRDSKTLTELARERLYDKLTDTAEAWEVGIVSHRVIDQLNIANASLRAMQEAIKSLSVVPQHLLIDGYFSSRVLQKRFGGIPASCECVVGGDAKVFSIAAASIIAKVTRDRLMRKLDAKFPHYGFARHKGYGTTIHYRALRLHGPCTIHRKTFYLGR